jgi:spore maturation protein CgeB
MLLVIFGLTVSSSWGNGHATLWRGLIRALGARGHRVVFFERDVPYYATHRDLLELPGHELVLYDTWAQVRGRAAQALEDADVGMVTSYCPDGPAAAALVLESPATIRCFYDMDAPITLERLEAGAPVEYLPESGLRAFDLVLSYAGGRTLQELQQRLGASRVAPLYGSVDPDVYRPGPPQSAFESDLSHLGTYSADRRDALHRFFLEPARQRPGRRFLLGGSMYPADFAWQPNVFYRAHVSPPEHQAFYNSSGFTLNVTRAAMARFGFCPSGRLFEAAACGTPILTDDWTGLDAFFEPGQEVIVLQHTDDVLGALELTDDERGGLARAARDRTLSEHSAEARVGDLERICDWARAGHASAGQTWPETPRPGAIT